MFVTRIARGLSACFAVRREGVARGNKNKASAPPKYVKKYEVT
jgi:hypothetical protein